MSSLVPSIKPKLAAMGVGAPVVLPSLTNLDNVTEFGFYYGGPFSGGPFGMKSPVGVHVFPDGSGGCIQRVTEYTDGQYTTGKTHERVKRGNTGFGIWRTISTDWPEKKVVWSGSSIGPIDFDLGQIQPGVYEISAKHTNGEHVIHRVVLDHGNAISARAFGATQAVTDQGVRSVLLVIMRDTGRVLFAVYELSGGSITKLLEIKYMWRLEG